MGFWWCVASIALKLEEPRVAAMEERKEEVMLERSQETR